MTAREYLGRARRIDRRIGETQERLRRMRGQIDGRVERVDPVIDMDLRLEKQIHDMCVVKLEVMDAIDGVGDPQLQEVLELYYLDGLSWAEVAERMHYSVRNVQILHEKALRRLHAPGCG